jgi:hypothetical protein
MVGYITVVAAARDRMIAAVSRADFSHREVKRTK